MWKRVLVVAAAVGAVACGNTSVPKIAFKQPEVRGRLQKNGLRFVVLPDTTTQLVEIDVRYEVGAREDPPGKAGLAHLVEHLMFQQRPESASGGAASGGAARRESVMQMLQQMALNMNAYTNWDTTHYMVNARADMLDPLLKVEAMRMFYRCETIPEEEFLREREVVRNEIRGHNRSAADLIEGLTLQAVYPSGHAYAQLPGGDDMQLSTITLRDACEFMQKYYSPERATVIVAGGVLSAVATSSIEQWFAAVEKRPPAPRREVERFTVAPERKTFELDIERPWLAVAWPLPDGRTAEGEAAQFGIWRAFLDAAFKADEYECATRATPEILGGREAPVFVIALELTSMSKLDQCLDFVWKAAHNAGHGWDGGMWKELEEAKNRRKAAFIASLEPLFGQGGRTDQVGDLVQFSRDVDFDSREFYTFHELDKIGKLEMASIGAATQRALDKGHARVVVFTPSKAGLKGDRRATVAFQARTEERIEDAEVDPGEADRPMRLPTDLKVFASATRFQLGNGMRVVLLPIDAMPVVAAELVIDVGDATAPDSPALAWAAADLPSLPPDANAFAETGVRTRCGTTPDHTICQAQGMSIYLDIVVKALERLVKAGWTTQKEVEQVQKSAHAMYQLRRPLQELAFRREQLAAVFGPEHAYARSRWSLQAIDKLGLDAITKFREEHYSASNATLIIAGTFDAKRAEATVRDVFGGWSAGHKDTPVPGVARARSGPLYVGVVGDEDPQIDVAILYPSPSGIAGEQAARLVLTEMLNAQMWDIRARLGATYGTYARRDARVGGSAYVLGGAVDAPRAGEAVRAMRGGIEALRNGTGFDEAFVRARRKVVQEMLGESTVSGELAARLALLARFGLEPKDANALVRQAAALSPAQVRQLLTHELDPKGEAVVMLGDRAALTKAFADAGIKDPKLVEPEGTPAGKK
ncbi:MAG TPA: insulinase family protein [Kofleriaceae bacterium]|nr:insulinase family protein [Kofleriaceae bacterium]